jgi:hypothetical protein
MNSMEVFSTNQLHNSGHEIGNEQIEPLTGNQTVRLCGASPGWTSPLAAAVRSEAEDERRSREQSVRALHSNLTEATN